MYNPLDWVKIYFKTSSDYTLRVKRDSRYGGNKTYPSYDEVEEEYKTGKLHLRI